MVQLISDLSFGDAASDDAVAWQRVFTGHGFESPIYARHIEGAHGGKAQLLEKFEPRPDDVALLHYTVWSETAELLRERRAPLVLMYHNVTPPAFFTLFDPNVARETRRGRDELATLASQTRLALAKSEYSRGDLDATGFRPTGALPILMDLDALRREGGDARYERGLRDGRTNVLVVGRVAPHKRIEECLMAFAHYRQIEPAARLHVVGGFDRHNAYGQRVEMLAQRLGFGDVFVGKVSRARLVSHYRAAHVLLTMSEHEGFCVPLIEAMALHVPIVARDATAIPETAGDAALYVCEKRFDVVAELLHLARRDDGVRGRLVERGQRRVEQYAAPRTESRLAELLGETLAAWPA